MSLKQLRTRLADCPDCGLRTDVIGSPHGCQLPILIAAAGVDLTEQEKRFLQWLAGMERESCDSFVSICWKIAGYSRGESGESVSDPHVLPTEPAWLTRLAEANGTHAMSDFAAHEIAAYVRQLREAAWPIVRALEDVGDQTNWQSGDETDRVYPWYEIEPLKNAVLGNRS